MLIALTSIILVAFSKMSLEIKIVVSVLIYIFSSFLTICIGKFASKNTAQKSNLNKKQLLIFIFIGMFLILPWVHSLFEHLMYPENEVNTIKTYLTFLPLFLGLTESLVIIDVTKKSKLGLFVVSLLFLFGLNFLISFGDYVEIISAYSVAYYLGLKLCKFFI